MLQSNHLQKNWCQVESGVWIYSKQFDGCWLQLGMKLDLGQFSEAGAKYLLYVSAPDDRESSSHHEEENSQIDFSELCTLLNTFLTSGELTE
ncbi:hypothetical protein DMENIID0001_163030 [Sergentomyia squamirostris]